MGLRSNKVKRSQLQPGDHIYSYRRLHAYAHHGIYVEADRVIHFTRTEVATKKRWFLGSRCKICGYHKKQAAGGVVKTCVNCFLDRHKLYRFEYGVSPAHFAVKNPGTCSTGRSDSADTVIRRATDFLDKKKGFGDYDLFKNNCESFAVLCKTGKSMSAQAFSALNAVKIVFKAFVKQNVERLQQDVYLHHPNKYMELNQSIDTLGTSSGVKEIIATLKKLKEKYDDDQEDVNDEDLLDDDESVETMEKEGDDDGDKSIESTTNLSTTSAIKT